MFNASGVFIDPGTYQGTQFFILRDGSYTFPAPPVTFTVPDNTTQIQVTQACHRAAKRLWARHLDCRSWPERCTGCETSSTLPDAVNFYVNGVKQTCNSVLREETTRPSRQRCSSPSAVLNSALAIDVYGYNLFNLIEMKRPGICLGI